MDDSDGEQGRIGKKSTRVCPYVLVESLVYCTVSTIYFSSPVSPTNICACDVRPGTKMPIRLRLPG